MKWFCYVFVAVSWIAIEGIEPIRLRYGTSQYQIYAQKKKCKNVEIKNRKTTVQ